MNISVRSFYSGTTPGLNQGSIHSSQAKQCIPLDILTYALSTGSRNTCLHGGRAINHFYTPCISRHIPHGLQPTHRRSETTPVCLGSFSLQLHSRGTQAASICTRTKIACASACREFASNASVGFGNPTNINVRYRGHGLWNALSSF